MNEIALNQNAKDLLKIQLNDLSQRVKNAIDNKKTDLAQSLAVECEHLLRSAVLEWNIAGCGLVPLLADFKIIAPKYMLDKQDESLLQFTDNSVHRCIVIVDQLSKQREGKEVEVIAELQKDKEIPTGIEVWEAIENEFGINKRTFGRKINFVSDYFIRAIIFRDVEQSFILASWGFSKPAVILAGGVIEELLRLYLDHRGISPVSDNFDGYIKACEQNGLLKSGISRLSDSARHFRNIVHLSKEQTKKHTISKATAVGAVSSIFTIANDF